MNARICLTMAAALVLASCGVETSPVSEVPHGYVEGAEETAEAQPRLVLADEGTGQVRVLDLITEEVTEAGRVEGVDSIRGDGRFAYLTTDRSVHIVDSGSWMVDHGDHAHYYRAEIRDTGMIRGERVESELASEPSDTARPRAATPSLRGVVVSELVGAHSDSSVAAVSFAGGTVTLLDRAELERGTVAETGTVELAGEAVPYREHVLTALDVRDRTGEPVATIDEPCPGPRGAAVTRRGVVFGCADGALLVTEQDGTFTATRIANPEADRAREFRHRPSSATLVAPTEDGVLLLDVAKRTWTPLRTGPVVATNTAGAGTPVLTLTGDGVLHALDPETGAETARTTVLAEPLAPGAVPPVIEVDTTRAYVNDAAAGVVHEIDYNDGLRVARTFPLDIAPTHMVETGR